MGIRKALSEVWHVLSQGGENLNRSTRYVLSVLSFVVITAVMLIAFGYALWTTNEVRFLTLIELVTHLSYVLGACVGVYVGAASIFPSLNNGYGYFESTTAFFKKKALDKEGQDRTPPAPSEDDAQVD